MKTRKGHRRDFTPIYIHYETKLALELVIREHHHIFNYDQAICYLLQLDGKRVPHTEGKIPEPNKVFLKRWIHRDEVK